ncbi:glutathione S-transferase [Actibacterium pelagium]|uniref:Glutathione S-transferase n=1 Tax=Actibacterium pelagium TaxID=2029103 RepID=A0A917AH10_9RHOB|nr:glutathione S-transferase [Actibacterium pelagium]GGE51963.1 glutathione S-transferase [Actibacterium pelagium]
MTPILWSFRRCPYAIRARLALAVSGQQVELREVLLRDKAEEFLQTSPSATIPCLKTEDQVIDESLDIMLWALRRHDPEGWLDMPSEGMDLITLFDGPFKAALDRYKYHTRFVDADAMTERDTASAILRDLNARQENGAIFDQPRLADFAILPFVRQFAFTDKPWFDAQDWPHLAAWLEAFLTSDRFAQVMPKYAFWSPGDTSVIFPAT